MHPNEQQTVDQGAGRRWFSAPLEQLGASYAAVVLQQTQVYNEFHPPGQWSVDLDASMFHQGDSAVHIAPLGTLGTDGSWLWAWANDHMNPPGSPRLAASTWLRSEGQRLGAPELTEPRLELAEFDDDPRRAAERLTMAAMGLLQGRGYGGVTLNTGARLFMVMDDPKIPLANFQFETLPRMIMQAVEVFPHYHRETARGFLDRYAFSIRADTGSELVGERSDCRVTFTFDLQERLQDISLKNA